jgi:hypothetical protein
MQCTGPGLALLAPSVTASVMLRNEGGQEGTSILRHCHTEGNMQKLSSLLFTTLINISIIALARESIAQKSATP